jgi:hypothetical protein
VHFRGEMERVTGKGYAIWYPWVRQDLYGHSNLIDIYSLFLQEPKDLNCDLFELWKHSLGLRLRHLTISELTNHYQRQRAFSFGLVHEIVKVGRLQLTPQSFCDEVGDAI